MLQKFMLPLILTLIATSFFPLWSELLPEIELIEIELRGDITDRNSELSGMTWYNDNLILLPQYPNFPEYEGGGRIFYIPREKLLERIVGDVALPIEPGEISLEIDNFSKIPGFEGFEAIAFRGNEVYLTVESEPDKIKGYIIRGEINAEMTEIRLDSLICREIEPQADVPNASEESILIWEDQVIILYEANGRNINPAPVAHVYYPEQDSLSTIEFPNLEYRVTDATSLDNTGRFWVINYFWPGEKAVYDPAADLVVEKYGTGATHAATDIVERLIQLRYYQGRIITTALPPVLLKLDTEARNLEGIVRFDDLGFLLCTDKFPRTILGFVPYNQVDLQE
jgi:hypothetical protein